MTLIFSITYSMRAIYQVLYYGSAYKAGETDGLFPDHFYENFQARTMLNVAWDFPSILCYLALNYKAMQAQRKELEKDFSSWANESLSL
jgi:hypothetical protein